MTFAHVFNFLHFRNPQSVPVVIIQCFMLLSALLVVIGLIYIAILCVAIVIHHFTHDRDARRVPAYVKNALMFDTDSESEECIACQVDDRTHKKSVVAVSKTSELVQIIEEEEEKPNVHTPSARKMANLDKFMHKDLDVKKG